MQPICKQFITIVSDKCVYRRSAYLIWPLPSFLLENTEISVYIHHREGNSIHSVSLIEKTVIILLLFYWEPSPLLLLILYSHP